MIWKVAEKIWPAPRDAKPHSRSMAEDEDEVIPLQEYHECESACPLLQEEGCCPLAGPRRDRRRSSEASSWSRESGASRRLLRPLQVSSLDNLSAAGEGDGRYPIPSPGLLSINSLWSTSDLQRSPRRIRHVDPDAVSSLTNTNSLSNVSSTLSDRMHELVRAFSSRTQRTKERTAQPPTPSSDSDCDDAKSALSGFDDPPPPPRNIRLDSFIPMESRASGAFSEAAKDTFVGVWHCRFKLPKCLRKLRFPNTIEPQSKFYIAWLFLVCLAFMYNCWTIPLRGLFPYQTPSNVAYWMLCDYLGDLIYIVDITIFKPRIRFVNEGTYETDRSLTKKHYMKKWMFKLDVMSLLPLDLFYLLVGVVPWLRLPRTLKVQTFWEFYERCDQAARTMVHVIRVIKTMTYMLFLIHIETCGYYAVSLYEGINSNRWVYNGTGNAYIRCFYLATKTATSIGNNPKPTNQLEYMFMTLYWLSGVFVFALLIGQIRDIVQAAGHVKETYQKRVDATLWYMNSLNIPKPLQDRVRDWFNYNWEQQKTLDEKSLLETLPKKLQTDLAINVHFNTLSKVQLFQDCDKLLLYDLVLKLRPVVYLPGDYICRKGEVGKEMYIVSLGQVEVVGGEDGDTVLATLHEGSVFGEISLLAMSGLGGNRRTANVRCTGYTNLFILSKGDFEEAMREYPEAQKLLKRRAKKLLKENARREKKPTKIEPENIIKTPPGTPRLLRAVIQVMNPESEVVKQLGSSLHLQGKAEGEHTQASCQSPEEGEHTQASCQSPEEGETNSHHNHAYQHGSELATSIPQISLPNLVPPSPMEDDSDGEGDNDDDEDDLEEELLMVEKMDSEQTLLPEPKVREPHIRAPTPTPHPPGMTKTKGNLSLESQDSGLTSLRRTHSQSTVKTASQGDSITSFSTSDFTTVLSKDSMGVDLQGDGIELAGDHMTGHSSALDLPSCTTGSLRAMAGSFKGDNFTLAPDTPLSDGQGDVFDFQEADIRDFLSTPEIPAKNMVTCSVEIHREKTKTPSSIFALSPTSESRMNDGLLSNETEL